MNRKATAFVCVLCVALGATAWTPAMAQEAAFPTKPITLVIPFPPGGATDVLGRLIGKKLGDKLGQSVVIDNRAGAGTVIGATSVARAARWLHAAHEFGHHLHRQPRRARQAAV